MYPKAYIDFLAHFHGSRDYFECHEVLEEYWKDEQGGNKHAVWVGLIQIAVSLYHFRRKNYTGAERMLQNAIRLVKQTTEQLEQLALEPPELIAQLEQLLNEIKTHQPFHDILLPISDHQLLTLCKNACLVEGYPFGTMSDLTNDALIHKHKLRDRRAVIQERQYLLDEKKRRRLTN